MAGIPGTNDPAIGPVPAIGLAPAIASVPAHPFPVFYPLSPALCAARNSSCGSGIRTEPIAS